eukprot:Selendium_serpulae@DN5468_c0_g1_i1.p1
MVPPRQTQRAQSSKRTGLCFLVCLVHVIFLVYFAYTIILLRPLIYPNPKWYSVIYPFFFNVVFFLFIAALFKSSGTDPGTVPSQYAFHMGDERKRRRYCKVCNVWKPDRTHHCSACNRCVLNMDHHCPWLNNCIGFENRKYFLQLLVYALILSFVITVHGVIFLFQHGGELFPSDEGHKRTNDHRPVPTPYINDESEQKVMMELAGIIQFFSVCAMCLLGLVLVLALVPFTRFHLNLVLKNSTTIESMDTTNTDHSRYDLGTAHRNCQQVFGRNPALYFLPCDTRGTTPVGDGVNWGEHYLRLLEENGGLPGGRAGQGGYARGSRSGTAGRGRGTRGSVEPSSGASRNGQARQGRGDNGIGVSNVEMAPRISDRV